MRIDAREWDEPHLLRVIDKPTGSAITRVLWADTDSGEIGVLRTDADGYLLRDDSEYGIAIETVKASFKIIHRDSLEMIAETA